MKVILLQDIKGTGKKEQVIEVSDGYARNYLFPRKLAKEATTDTLNSLKNAKNAQAHREDQKKQEAQALARDLEGKSIRLSAKAGENGRLFGAVTATEVASAIEMQLGVVVDRRKVELDSIKSLGTYTAKAKLYPGTITHIEVIVTAES